MHGALQEPDTEQTLAPDLRAAEQFLFLLASPTEEVPEGGTIPPTKHTFFVVGDSDAAKKHVHAESRHGTLRQHADWLTRQNQRGAGVFVCIHEMDESGNRKEANFKRIRTIVADHDNGIPTEQPPCTPTMIVRTSPGKQHVYFVVGENISKEEYVDAQKWLTAHWGNDKQVKDVTRVMRLPGFYHRKSAKPHLVTFEVPEGGPQIYSRATILRNFPSAQTKAPTKSLSASRVQLPAVLPSISSSKRYTLTEVADALDFLDPDDRTDWVDYGHAIKRDHQDAGLETWLEWSSKSSKFDEDEARRRWDGFDVSQDGPEKIHCGTIVQRARRAKANVPLPVHKDGDELMKELAGDEKAEMSRGDLQDPKSLKNVAIFLLSEKIMPWCNEFDSNYYLRDADNKDTKLSDVSLRDLEMKMYRKGLRVSTDFCEKAVTWFGDKRTAHPVRFYLDNLKWDGTPRLDKMLQAHSRLPMK